MTVTNYNLRWIQIEKWIRGYAFSHHTADAEDFIQEALLALWQMTQADPTLWQNSDSYLTTKAIWKTCEVYKTEYRRRNRFDNRDVADIDPPDTNRIEEDVAESLAFMASVQEIAEQLSDVHQAVFWCMIDALGEGNSLDGTAVINSPFTRTGRIKRNYLMKQFGRSRASISRSIAAIAQAMTVSSAFTGA